MLHLAGTLAFALNGVLTAIRTVQPDIVGVITFAMITAIGGGIIRDILARSLGPQTPRTPQPRSGGSLPTSCRGSARGPYRPARPDAAVVPVEISWSGA